MRSPPINVAAIESEASKYDWYHRIALAPGYITPGLVGEDTPDWEETYLFPSPSEFQSKSVLDIGTFQGFFAFQAEKRGASRVVAIDRDPPGSYCDPPEPLGPRDAFKFAARTLGSKVIYRVRSVYELEPSDFGVFDIVLMYGVLYHLKFPMYGLYRAAAVCRELLVLEMHVILKDDFEWPVMLFYPRDELAKDSTNWWGLNPSCVDAFVEHLGFVVERRTIVNQSPHPLPIPSLSQARYAVRCRRVAPTPAPFSDL